MRDRWVGCGGRVGEVTREVTGSRVIIVVIAKVAATVVPVA